MVDIGVLKGGDVRAFVQQNGISPANPFVYFGKLQLSGITQSQPTPDPSYLPSSTQRNKWDIVDRIPKAQELGKADWTQRSDRSLNDAWWEIRRRACLFNAQLVMGSCQNPSDITQWDAKLLVTGILVSGDVGLDGTLNVLAGGDNKEVDMKGSWTFTVMQPIYALRFGLKADAVITTEILDGFYNDVVSCGDCGPASDGRAKSYYLSLAASASPGLSSQIIYSLDDDNTYAAMDINTLGGLSGTRAAAVGTKLVVISQANNAHHIIDFTDINAGISAWARVASGYVAAKGPRAIWSKSAAETYVAAAAGYLYMMVDPSVGVTVLLDGSLSLQDFNDIHGLAQTIVAVGNNNVVAVSTDSGASFSLVVGPTPGIGLNAVWISATYVWWVGTANGKLFFSLNQGATWTEKVINSQFTTINDIGFVDDVVGYVVAQASGGAVVYRTTDGGYSWQNKAPSLTGLPTGIERLNFVAVAGHNKASVGGRISSGGDGRLLVAE